MRPIDIALADLETVRSILREHAPGLEVRAFGSRVSFTARETSDLDLALLTEETLSIARMTNLKAAFTKSYLPFRVDIVDWASASENFRKVIEREHVVLVEKQGTTDSDQEVTAYGILSADRRKNSLTDLCHHENGIQTGPFGSQLHQRDYVPVGTPIITVEHLGENRITHKNLPRVSDNDKERLSKYTLRKGDIVFSRVGSVDRRALVREAEEGWLFSGRCLRVRPDPNKVNPKFLSYFFGWRPFQEHIRSIAVGATMPSLNTQLLSDVFIHYPSLSTQCTIAHILGTLDDKIELNRRMNKTLEEMAQALFKSWFVDFEPVKAKLAVLENGGTADEAERAAMRAISGKDEISLAKLQNEQPVNFASLAQTAAQFPSVMQNSQLGKIPKGWNLGCLSQVAIHLRKKTNPMTTPNSLFQHFSIPAFDYDRLPRLEHGKKIKSQKSNVLPGVVLLSKLNPEIERVWLVDVESNSQAICSTEFLVLQPKPPFGRGYLYYLVRSSRFRQEIQSLVTGTSKSHQRAPSETVLNIPVVLPSCQIADLFELRTNGWLKSILLNFRVNKCLDSLRETILPKLISGELIVNSEEP